MQGVVVETAEINWVLQHTKDGSEEASRHAMRWLQLHNVAVRHRLLALNLHGS